MGFKTVRTRFAPSPTGYMHVGNLRTALYAYLWAKKNNGTFILRIEDTDQERYIDGAVEIIYKTMAETGLIHDEGPDKDAGFGPYIQSERLPLYKEKAIELVEKGKAYYCFCDKERLKSGVPFVIRQKIPTEGVTTFKDEVFGEISVDNSTLDDQVLLKSDGYPTYNFANVVDDHLMEISHVIRGTEYLSSTPKYNLLYEAFGWEIPQYIHCSPVMRDAQRKLSKRDGDASYQDFIDKGYLTEAVMNYIALLGWNPGNDREKFTLSELCEAFSIDGISKSPAIFDPMKLTWLNGEYIRDLTIETFHEKALPWIRKTVTRNDIDTMKIAKLLHTRTEKFSDIPEQLDFIDALPEYDIELFVHKKMKTTPENSLESLKTLLPLIESIENWNHQEIHDRIMGLIEGLGIKNGLMLWPLRVAVSGKQFTPGGGIEIAEIIGKNDTISRIVKGIEKLGG